MANWIHKAGLVKWNTRIYEWGFLFIAIGLVGGAILVSQDVENDSTPQFGGSVPSPEPTKESLPAEKGDPLDVISQKDAAPVVLPGDAVIGVELLNGVSSDGSASKQEWFFADYGFGPYPAVPEEYPLSESIPWTWSQEYIAELKERMGPSLTAFMKENELKARVGIKLWNAGRRFDDITTHDNTELFYPNEFNVLYVQWDETTLPNGDVGRRMSDTIGTVISDISMEVQEGRKPPPNWLEIRSFDDGIAPYEFLGLK